MFDVFGEMESAEELNQAAAGLLQEGDKKGILTLAKENGIDKELAEAYAAGELPYLTDDTMAAIGKIDMELPAMEKTYGATARCVADYVKGKCENALFAKKVRRKGKSLEGVLKNMYQAASKEKRVGNCACIPPNAGFKLIRDYYEK